MSIKDNKHNNRRDFLKKGITGMAALGSGSFLYACGDNNGKSDQKIRLLSPEGEVVEVARSEVRYFPDIEAIDKNVREGVEGRRFVMVINLRRCRNVQQCRDACAKMHVLPSHKSYLNVLKMQDAETTYPYWMPQPCFQCDNPPCVKVCPTGATFKRTDGVVGIDNERCIGCRFCMVACPYSARQFNWGKDQLALDRREMEQYKKPQNDLEEAMHRGAIHTAKTSERYDVTKSDMENVSLQAEYTHKVGTVEKCDFCPSFAAKGELPPCVPACPNGVIYYGDENEDAVSNGQETVRLSSFLRENAAYRYLEELGTKPRVYYIPPVSRRFPFEDTPTGTEKIRDRYATDSND